VTGPLVVVAPDKFKGSVTAADAAAALAGGILRSAPSAQVERHPIADGGEGTVDLLLAHGWEPRSAQVEGPLGGTVTAQWARLGDTAVLEAAAACGLGLLPGPPTPATALAASTTGVGQLLEAALDDGATRLLVGIGGTASTDGGAGAVAAVRAERWGGVRLEVACDVRNPLLGPSGAAAVYGPQKGADPGTVTLLEERLAGWSETLRARTGRAVADQPGTGAGGGLAYGLAAGLGGRIVPGAATLLELTGTLARIRQADLLVVGEGSLDEQSLYGKAPVALATTAAEAGVPVVAVVGRSLVDPASAARAGIDTVHTLLAREPDPDACMRRASTLLAEVGAEIGAGLAALTGSPSPVRPSP
jgi:glycerate kinase